jgi:class 3 adenylate cyclase
MEEERDISKLLEERVKLDSLLYEKFCKKITVMFTDIKGSTLFYETHGDIDGRIMVHRHNEIVLPFIEKNSGILLKTIGDATMSFFEKPEEGLHAAVQILQALTDYNCKRPVKEQIHVRIGLNYGTGIVEHNDIYGDIVNVASRVESIADAGEIIVTEDLYKAVRSNDEFIFRFFKKVAVKGKNEPIRAYRLIWQPEEVYLGKLRKPPAISVKKEGFFMLEASVSNARLKVSGVEKSEGEERAVKSYDEMAYGEGKISEYTQGITELLNRANRRGKIGNDLLIKLKEYGRMLFDELIPIQTKERLADTQFRHLLISIDDNLVHIPWELLYDGKDFICRRFSIGRTVSTRQRVSQVVRAIGNPLKMQVLADPKGDLAASYKEGVELKEEISRHEDIMDVSLKTTEISAGYVKAKIRNFDIIHYAGHADHNVRNPGQSGWLLYDGKISADEIISMTGMMPMPSLVFSNACRTAQTGEWRLDEDYEHRIFGLANAFLLSGVQHYIGTFWEIPDEAGRHFALNFYKSLVKGASIGEAVRLARQDLIDKYGEDMIVWASYLLYGDPTIKYVVQEIESINIEPKIPEKEDLIGAELRHGAERISFSEPSRISGNNIAMIIAAVVVAAVIGLYLFQSGRRGDDAKATGAMSSVPAIVREDNSKRTDELVASLVKDFREGKTGAVKASQEDWTSRPLAIVFIDIKPEDAAVDKMVAMLSQKLQDSGRAGVVERGLLAKLLGELKLSASALADPATALKLGKVLSARLVVTGSVISGKKTRTVLLRFIDTETTLVRKVITAESDGPEMTKDFIDGMGTKIADFLKADLPLHGIITAVSDETCRVNLGQVHGLKKGDLLEVVKEQHKVPGLYLPVSEIEITEVAKDASAGKIIGMKEAVVYGAKIRERSGGQQNVRK